MNLTIRDQPIFEDENQAQQAMDDMANTLRMVSSTPSRRNPPVIVLIRSIAGSDETERRHHSGPSRRTKHSFRSELKRGDDSNPSRTRTIRPVLADQTCTVS
jgi:hypothetical protein